MLEVTDLLDFIEKKMPKERRKEIEKLLISNRTYGEMFLSVKSLWDQLGSRKAVEEFFASSRIALKDKIQKKKGK